VISFAEKIDAAAGAGMPDMSLPALLRDTEDAQAAAAMLVTVLGSHRHLGVTEKHIQASVGRVLSHFGFAFRREYPLSVHDRPDFLVEGSVVIEVKMRASRSAVLMQLGRYAAHHEVTALILASPRYTAVAGLPDRIHGKPVEGLQLPGAGLA
jgi:hypothetical protein